MLRHLAAAVLLALALALPAASQGIVVKGAKGPGPVAADLFNDPLSAPPTLRRGGEVTMAEQVSFRSLDPDQDNSSSTSEVVHNYIMESLVDSDTETWASIGRLAERWDVEDNLELKGGKVVRGRVKETGDGSEVGSAPPSLFTSGRASSSTTTSRSPRRTWNSPGRCSATRGTACPTSRTTSTT
jgi:hypothetical protein